VITVCRQRISLGRQFAGQIVRVHAADTTLTLELDGDTHTVPGSATLPVRNLKADQQAKRRDLKSTHP
jgi:hypothetical protein